MDEQTQSQKLTIKRNWYKNPFFVLITSIFLILSGILVFDINRSIGLKNFYRVAKNFVQAPAQKISSENGRVNILVMGQAGSDHEGSDLTDTMILVSVSLTNPKIVMISIPRDLWIPEMRAKINSAYHYGGIDLAKDGVQKVLGVKVHYGALLNFSGFKDIVDVMGGITVNVEKEFTDPLYPIKGKENDLCLDDVSKTLSCRYETLHFDAGVQLMDGERALKFVRSRHAPGDEGTDLAREARQQKVINAIENKLMDPNIFLNPQKSIAIWNVVTSSVQTDIELDTGAIIGRYVYNSISNIQRFLIPEDLLLNPPISDKFDKQYVFIPKAGNGKWSSVQSWANDVLP